VHLANPDLEAMLDSRRDDLKSGRLEPIDGEDFSKTCAGARTICLRIGLDDSGSCGR